LYGHHSRCTLRYFRVDVTDNPNERRTKKGATKNACPLFFILLFGTNADRTIRGSAQETILGGIGPGSALECAACLDVLVAMQLVLPQEIASGKEQIGEIVSMLTSLARSVAGDRINEEPVSYST